jgi:hypothetical protein
VGGVSKEAGRHCIQSGSGWGTDLPVGSQEALNTIYSVHTRLWQEHDAELGDSVVGMGTLGVTDSQQSVVSNLHSQWDCHL